MPASETNGETVQPPIATWIERSSVLVSRAAPLDNNAPECSQKLRHPRCRVLVADDYRDFATSMAVLLRLLGNEVVAVHDGIEAVETAETFRPEVILMDVCMPRLNGLDATRWIRGQPWSAAVVIIAMTTRAQESDRVQSREVGCNGCLEKPVNLRELKMLLTELTCENRTSQTSVTL